MAMGLNSLRNRVRHAAVDNGWRCDFHDDHDLYDRGDTFAGVHFSGDRIVKSWSADLRGGYAPMGGGPHALQRVMERLSCGVPVPEIRRHGGLVTLTMTELGIVVQAEGIAAAYHTVMPEIEEFARGWIDEVDQSTERDGISHFVHRFYAMPDREFLYWLMRRGRVVE